MEREKVLIYRRLQLLQEVLRKEEIPERDYSLRGFSEDRVCLEFKNNTWSTYTVERGYKFDLHESDDFWEVVRYFIFAVSDTPKKAERIYSTFKKKYEGKIKKQFKTNAIALSDLTLSLYPQVREGQVWIKDCHVLHKDIEFANYKIIGGIGKKLLPQRGGAIKNANFDKIRNRNKKLYPNSINKKKFE